MGVQLWFGLVRLRDVLQDGVCHKEMPLHGCMTRKGVYRMELEPCSGSGVEFRPGGPTQKA